MVTWARALGATIKPNVKLPATTEFEVTAEVEVRRVKWKEIASRNYNRLSGYRWD